MTQQFCHIHITRLLWFVIFRRLRTFIIYIFTRLIEFVIFRRLSTFVIYVFTTYWVRDFPTTQRIRNIHISTTYMVRDFQTTEHIRHWSITRWDVIEFVILRWLFRFVICRWSLSSWFFDDSVHLLYIKHSLKICHGSRRSHLKIITTAKIYNKFSWESPYILNMFPRESPKFQTGFNMSQWSARYSKEWTGKPSKSGDPKFSSVISSVSGHWVHDVQMTS